MANLAGRIKKVEQRAVIQEPPSITLTLTWRTPEERAHAEAMVAEHRKHEGTPRLPGQGILKYASKEFGT